MYCVHLFSSVRLRDSRESKLSESTYVWFFYSAPPTLSQDQFVRVYEVANLYELVRFSTIYLDPSDR